NFNDDGADIECTFPLDFPDFWGHKLMPDMLTGEEPGLVLAGTFFPEVGTPQPSPKPFLKITEVEGFSYGIKGDCSNLTIGWTDAVLQVGAATACAITVKDDPLEIFAVSWSKFFWDGKIHVLFPATLDQGKIEQYFADPATSEGGKAFHQYAC